MLWCSVQEQKCGCEAGKRRTLDCHFREHERSSWYVLLSFGIISPPVVISGSAEGVATAPAALGLAEKLGVDVPIISGVNDVLKGKMNAAEALYELMMRPASKEFE